MLSRFTGALLAALLVALPRLAVSQDGSVPADKLVDRYAALAGSHGNAKALVSGLRNDTEVKLTSRTSSASFTPPTGKMGYGNIDNALALAEASLKAQGITHPTPEQLKAALVGGTVNGTKLDGVLALRASGQGWGEIAQSLGFKLGDVKRADVAQRTERAARPEKPERPERPERPEKPERPQKGGR
jgi:hypothetical protein